MRLATESYSYALTGRVDCLSANHLPVEPLHLQAYHDTACSLGYPLAVVSLIQYTMPLKELRVMQSLTQQ